MQSTNSTGCAPCAALPHLLCQLITMNHADFIPFYYHLLDGLLMWQPHGRRCSMQWLKLTYWSRWALLPLCLVHSLLYGYILKCILQCFIVPSASQRAAIIFSRIIHILLFSGFPLSLGLTATVNEAERINWRLL